MYRIGVDVGGTFTDFTIVKEQDGAVFNFKIPSTPQDPSKAIQDGVRQMLANLDIAPEAVSYLGHGTTVATNMVIERRGAATGLLTTKGFKDVLEIGRQVRPRLYDYTVGKQSPLVAREHRLEIPERVGPGGEILKALDEAELKAAVEQLKTANIQSVAVCFLHSYQTPNHEKRARAVVERLMPEAYISLSCEVLPEFREYERLSTTVLNAFIGPRMQTYLERFLARVRELGIKVTPYTTHSNGGLMSPQTVRANPVRTCLSGPAAGVVGATEVARVAGFPNIVTFDVGGTSTDVALVHDSQPLFTSSRTLADFPIKTPMIDIHVIGAGGGSIARMDDAGALKVGPHSAGAEPGPVAYHKGGTEPTITDANICLHRLNPDELLGGQMPIDAAGARQAISEKVAGPLAIDTEKAAYGILRIANANMSRAIRSVSTERGYDITKFTLFAYGGAGPLHAAEIAQECGIPTVIIPHEPGTMCARGMLLSDISLDFVRSEIALSKEETWRRVCDLFEEMLRQGQEWLEREGVPANKTEFRYHVDARYQGQNYEVMVDLDRVQRDGLSDFLERFCSSHIKEYGYDIPGRTVEIVNCRVKAIGSVAKARQHKIERSGSVEEAVTERRDVYFGDGLDRVPTNIFRRDHLPIGVPFEGPAVIEEMSSTTIVLPYQRARLDVFGNIVIEVDRKEGI
jgi:N-methylhydantoinase A